MQVADVSAVVCKVILHRNPQRAAIITLNTVCLIFRLLSWNARKFNATHPNENTPHLKLVSPTCFLLSLTPQPKISTVVPNTTSTRLSTNRFFSTSIAPRFLVPSQDVLCQTICANSAQTNGICFCRKLPHPIIPQINALKTSSHLSEAIHLPFTSKMIFQRTFPRPTQP